MRWVVLIACGVLVACGGPQDGDIQDGDAPFPAAQEIVDTVAAGHESLTRLTLHGVPTGKSELTQLASTMASRRGKPSDPEDLEAMDKGEEVILDEEGAIDVTVPILVKDGKPTAIAGVTLKMAEGANRDALVDEARAIAKELEEKVQAAGKPVW